jgi:hypothetical protein
VPSFRAVDTIWVVHGQRRKFDAEDERLLTGLASHDLSVPHNSLVLDRSIAVISMSRVDAGKFERIRRERRHLPCAVALKVKWTG